MTSSTITGVGKFGGDTFKIRKVMVKLPVMMLQERTQFSVTEESRLVIANPMGRVCVREPSSIKAPPETPHGYPVIMDEGEMHIEMIEGTVLVVPFKSSTHNKIQINYTFWWDLGLTEKEFTDDLFARYGREWFSINKRNMLGIQ